MAAPQLSVPRRRIFYEGERVVDAECARFGFDVKSKKRRAASTSEERLMYASYA